MTLFHSQQCAECRWAGVMATAWRYGMGLPGWSELWRHDRAALRLALWAGEDEFLALVIRGFLR